MATKLKMTKEAIARRTRDRNRRFQALTAAEKRVAVAKDVLEQLEAGKYLAETGSYFRTRKLHQMTDGSRLATRDKDVRTLLETEKCHVCARGACFASVVRFQNGVTLGDLYDRVVDSSNPDYFSSAQLAAIEAAFERWHGQDGGLPWDARSMARWVEVPADDRMRFIMENIIANKGTFNAEQLHAEWKSVAL